MSDGDVAKRLWLARVLGAPGGESDGAAASGAGSAEGAPGNGLAAWTAARDVAVKSLESVEAAIRGMELEPEDRRVADEAVMLVRSVRANLSVAPVTPQQVSELQRYIETDDVIEEAEGPNGFGIRVDLREPLLSALRLVERDVRGRG